MCEGILRARYREGASRPSLLEPGKSYELAIELSGTSNVFLKGHRIRVDVDQQPFPRVRSESEHWEAIRLSVRSDCAADDLSFGGAALARHTAGNPRVRA